MKALLLFLAVAAAERPELVSGKLEVIGAAASLASEVQSLRGTVWAGYAVPMISGSHHLYRALD